MAVLHLLNCLPIYTIKLKRTAHYCGTYSPRIKCRCFEFCVLSEQLLSAASSLLNSRNMKCRHCLVEFHDDWFSYSAVYDADGAFMLSQTACAKCNRLHIAYSRVNGTRILIYPRSTAYEPVDPSVPPEFAGDYIEACNVVHISPKASAALSRRCLQHLLRECAKVKAPNLDQEIQQVIKGGMVPSYIAESLDAVRNIGNFAAHPMKSTSSGEVVEVESGEAEWNLDTIAQLFDFYFVGPAKKNAQKAALNQKLKDAGKPPLK